MQYSPANNKIKSFLQSRIYFDEFGVVLLKKSHYDSQTYTNLVKDHSSEVDT